MAKYLLRRLLQTFAFIILALLLIYTAFIYFWPGGPGEQYRDLQQPPPGEYQGPSNYVKLQMAELDEKYKLGRPWPISFLAWFFDPTDTVFVNAEYQEEHKGIDLTLGPVHVQGSGILTLDFGKSTANKLGKQPILDLFGIRWGPTLLLVFTSLTISLLIAIPLGIISAVRQRSSVDRVASFVSFAVQSMPPFVLGLLLITFLSVLPRQLHTDSNLSWVPYFPISDAVDSGQGNNLANRLYHLVLPAMALGLIYSMWLFRQVRASMLGVLKQEYIRVARAKGLSTRSVVMKHALRNALIPLATVFGLMIPAMASGAIVIESVFNYPGMGYLFFTALGGCIDLTHEVGNCPGSGFSQPDYPLAVILTGVLVILVAISNLLADFLYIVFDPRVSYARFGK